MRQFLKVSTFCCRQPRLWASTASTASLPPMGKDMSHDELHQFSVNQVWYLLSKKKRHTILVLFYSLKNSGKLSLILQ